MKITQTIYLSNGEVYTVEYTSPQTPPTGTPPIVQDAPIEGVFERDGDEFIYVVHDDLTLGYARTLDGKILGSMTNEIFVPRRWYFRDDIQEWRVDRYSKIAFWPEDLDFGWTDYFFSGMTSRQRELFNQTAFGWRDAKANAIISFFLGLWNSLFKQKTLLTHPEGLNPYHFLLTGGSLLKKAGVWREYTLFSCQDTNKPPIITNYRNSPHLWFKQGVCGNNADKESYYGKVNPNQGDLIIPTACPDGIAAILTSQTRSVLKVPFDAVLDNFMSVTFVELCFRGSEVLGKTDFGEWYYILEQRTKDGNQADFVLHIPKEFWPVLPISVVDWQKT